MWMVGFCGGSGGDFEGELFLLFQKISLQKFMHYSRAASPGLVLDVTKKSAPG